MATIAYAGSGVRITKAPDDPICLRLSIGGIPPDGYCVYRGKIGPNVKLLRLILGELEMIEKLGVEPEIDKSYNKKHR